MRDSRLWYYRYELVPMRSLNSQSTGTPRKGALLRLEDSEGRIGYADCHPWPELGDLVLDEQLNALAQDRLTPLLQRSLEFACQDAFARNQGSNLLSGLAIPPSHFLALDVAELNESMLQALSEQGFRLIKIKVGRNLALETSSLSNLSAALDRFQLKLRLDFNNRLTADEFGEFLEKTASFHRAID